MRNELFTVNQRPNLCYRFLDWSVEPGGNRLRRAGEQVRVTPRAMDVLSYLIERADQVVSKEELVEQVWGGQAVTDDALVVTIYELRKALGDRARQPTYIETVVRRGYRFLPSVEKVTTPPCAMTTLVVSPQPLEPSPEVHPSTSALRVVPPGSPFPHLGRRAGRLAGLLAVTFLTLVFGFDAFWLGGGLSSPVGFSSFDAEGSWAEAAPAESADRAAPSEDPPWLATELAAARRELDRRTPQSLAESRRRYADIEARLPGDARALAGQARVAALEADLRLGDRFDLYFEARALAEEALFLDPQQTDALLALASAQLFIEWNPAAAHQSLKQALAQSPDDPDVHQIRSWWLSASGSHGGAIEAAEEAVRLSPGSVTKRSDLAFVLMAAGHFDRAALEAQAVLDQDPDNAGAWAALISSHLGAGSLDRALHSHLEMLREFGVDEEQLAAWISIAKKEGYWTFAEGLHSATAPESALVPRAAALANIGEKESALGLLERAVERRDWEVLWLESLPEFAPLRTERRFQALLEHRFSLRSGFQAAG